MVGVRVGYKYGVDLGQVGDGNPRGADTRKELAERWVEIRVGKETPAADFN
jgi:hypothetical protein